MAGSQSNIATTGLMSGLNAAKAAVQAIPDIAREAMLSATETTVSEIKRGAQARLLASPSIQTRNLYNSIAFTVSKQTGRGRVGVVAGSTVIRTSSNAAGRLRNVRVRGIITAGPSGGASGARVDYPSRRAHFVEFGTRKMKAEPFMIPAAEAERGPALARHAAAGKVIEQRVRAIGLGGGRVL